MVLKIFLYLLLAIVIQKDNKVSPQSLPSCASLIYCRGPLLDTVQRAGVFNDSKTFVDLRMLYDEKTILSNFYQLMKNTSNNPDRKEVQNFVENNFADGNELKNWTLPDYKENPSFLEKINNQTLRNFAANIVKIWPTLARKIKPEVLQNLDRYSIIPVPNGFVVPGGRFKEIYYWDSYWIIKGLLISEMPQTAQLMLENFLYLVDKLGFIPNGARVYYLNRSHPPLLTPMVRLFIDATNDLNWLQRNIKTLDKELQFFINNRTTNIEINGANFILAHYDSESGSPRPESYLEDVKTCAPLRNQSEIGECYADLKSGAESGWDFSFRWVFDRNGGNNANRTYIQTRRVIPVDLNSMLARAFNDLSYFYNLLGYTERAKYWNSKYQQWKIAIHTILYSREKGVWFDYDIKLGRHRQLFYPSNIAPLWAELYKPQTAVILGRYAYQYLLEEGILNYYGGTPTSLNNTGEQWDYPSAWAPLQSFVIQGLQKSGYGKAQNLARTLADRWINSNLLGFENTGEMYEKYDAEHPGSSGGGGEYTVQTGFGWTNGVALETIVDFFSS
ncbi:hypothetical protein HHI36_014283 [Cryptolaemus montrouzieri]|uniref:Trehalase n=1 Tax=Cryptolaemus montrouzieri TaxID=559131 RepID=A0ABD2N3D6_9CUCU